MIWQTWRNEIRSPRAAFRAGPFLVRLPDFPGASRLPLPVALHRHAQSGIPFFRRRLLPALRHALLRSPAFHRPLLPGTPIQILPRGWAEPVIGGARSEEHTSELQSL